MSPVAGGARRYAQLDVDLASWAQGATGLPVTAGQVEGWRRVGLLPEPTGVGERRDGRGGRRPKKWTEPELAQAQALVMRLAFVAGRGSSLTQLALELADEGLPVPGRTVLNAALDVLRETSRRIWEQLGPREALNGADGVARAAGRLADSNPGLVRSIQRRIPRPPGEAGGPDAGTALFAFVAMFSGVGLDELDDPALHTTLYAVGAHGVVEGAGSAEGPRLLPGGAGDLVGVLERFDLDSQIKLMHRFPVDLVHSGLDQTRALRDALQAAYDAQSDAAHHVAAEAILRGLDGPGGVVLRLVCWQAIRELTEAEPDATGPIQAIERLGEV